MFKQIIKPMFGRLRKFINVVHHESDGRFTLEATLVFPLLLVISLIIIYGSLFFNHYTVLYYNSSTLAERTAYEWHQQFDHDAVVLSDQVSDRLRHHPMMSLFRLGSGGVTTIHFPTQSQPHTGIRGKLQQGIHSVPGANKGSLSYVTQLFTTRIDAELFPTVRLPSFVSFFIDEKVRARGSATIVHPTEFIRTIDLAHTYLQQLISYSVTHEEASGAMQQFFNINKQPDISSHQDAFVYLQQLVHGKELHVDTSSGKRMIDAFDQQGVSHQAFYTFTRNSLAPQLAKDAELLADGRLVKGVVWHFFRIKGSTGPVGPQGELLREIEQKGIIVVIHE